MPAIRDVWLSVLDWVGVTANPAWSTLWGDFIPAGFLFTSLGVRSTAGTMLSLPQAHSRFEDIINVILAGTLTCKKAQVQVASQLLTFTANCTIVDCRDPSFLGFTHPLLVGWDAALSALTASLFMPFPVALPSLAATAPSIPVEKTHIADTPMQEDFNLIKVSRDQVESEREFNTTVEGVKSAKEARGLKCPSEESMPGPSPRVCVEGAQAFLDYLDNIGGMSIWQYYAQFGKLWGITHMSSSTFAVLCTSCKDESSCIVMPPGKACLCCCMSKKGCSLNTNMGVGLPAVLCQFVDLHTMLTTIQGGFNTSAIPPAALGEIADRERIRLACDMQLTYAWFLEPESLAINTKTLGGPVAAVLSPVTSGSTEPIL
ncbi:uncharacterized protein LAESUDRAFT_718099 [Laetiporus sulphureus 93-53]|uniref:Uncharacterized protein n=1 Tax=Laetiporus sulphureus 93-53 TaxID=1314785 RepID=A0A165B8J4_9APHY|nr:uncharacterized protein LAESUDRAFT_718099 [Laetiporus sulphureus 93-53]KZT00491.1 hypothetical protein LAESUDRAFT_718099 [Laetiporus sulphureus 93-53]